MAEARDAVRLEDVDFRYGEGDFALRVPELVVSRGEQLALVGPSGSGKTTLLHLVAGIATPRSGRVATGGALLTQLDEGARRAFRIRNVGLVFQEFELIEYLSVLDNVLLPYRLHAALELDAGVRARAEALCERVGIGHQRGRLVTRLSQGERQRVAVCRALVTQPSLVLADEPTGNLDPSNKDRVLEILCGECRRTGAALVTVTHDTELLERFERVVDAKVFQAGAARGAAS